MRERLKREESLVKRVELFQQPRGRVELRIQRFEQGLCQLLYDTIVAA
jgi:hypothetical protein